MGVKLKDLSPAARAQVEAQLGSKGGRGRKLSDAEVPGPGLPGRCECGERFASYTGKTGWEGHAGEPGHRRWCIILTDADAGPEPAGG